MSRNLLAMQVQKTPAKKAAKRPPERRARLRLKMSAPVRVRATREGSPFPAEVCRTLNVSRAGLYFTSASKSYIEGLELAVTFPYSDKPDATNVEAEKVAVVLRIESLADGRHGIAVQFADDLRERIFREELSSAHVEELSAEEASEEEASEEETLEEAQAQPNEQTQPLLADELPPIVIPEQAPGVQMEEIPAEQAPEPPPQRRRSSLADVWRASVVREYSQALQIEELPAKEEPAPPPRPRRRFLADLVRDPSTALQIEPPASNTPARREERRSRPRAKIGAAVRVRAKHSTLNFPIEICTTLEVSRAGLCFTTSNQAYCAGLELAVTFPYSEAPTAINVEQACVVVRVDSLPDNRRSVAVQFVDDRCAIVREDFPGIN
jgi:hypothetical protein